MKSSITSNCVEIKMKKLFKSIFCSLASLQIRSLQNNWKKLKFAKNCIAVQLETQTFDIFYLNMRASSNLINVQNDPIWK